MIDINSARKEVQDTYKCLKPIVKEVVDKHSKDIDAIIAKIKKNLDNLDYFHDLS